MKRTAHGSRMSRTGKKRARIESPGSDSDGDDGDAPSALSRTDTLLTVDRDHDNPPPSTATTTAGSFLSRASSSVSVAAQASSNEAEAKARDRAERIAFEKRYDCVNLSPEEILREFSYDPGRFRVHSSTSLAGRQQKTWSSVFYKHFHAPTIQKKGADYYYIFLCRKDGYVIDCSYDGAVLLTLDALVDELRAPEYATTAAPRI